MTTTTITRPEVPWAYLARADRAWERWLNGVGEAGGLAAVETPPPVSPTTSGGVWACIANAETGGDVSMHGPVYSTAFGMINDIVYQYGSPAQQADIFSGNGTFAEELDIASRFAADHGFGGWGYLTREKCGL